MRRFFIPSANIIDNTAIITDSDVHQIVHVLRKKPGDALPATDGQGNLLATRIKSMGENAIQLEILSIEKAEDRTVRLRLFQAIPRGGIIDDIVEKACELGVAELVPVVTERTVSQPHQERGLKKRARWEKIALETMKQVGRSSAMVIGPVTALGDIKGMLDHYTLKILFWELEDTVSLKSLLREKKGVKNVDIIIGPEGGFSAAEIDFLTGEGFITASLGKRVLKVETAAVTAVANVFLELEE